MINGITTNIKWNQYPAHFDRPEQLLSAKSNGYYGDFFQPHLINPLAPLFLDVETYYLKEYNKL